MTGAGGLHRRRADWCDHCGRRRGGDGRCVECDGWWTHPLLVFGVPIVGGTTALLVTFLLMSGPTARGASLLATSQSLRPATAPVFAGSTGSRAGFVNPSGFLAAARPLSRQPLPPMPVLPPPSPAPEAMQIAELGHLRAITDSAETAVGRVEAANALQTVPPSLVSHVPVAATAPAIVPPPTLVPSKEGSEAAAAGTL